MYFHQARGEWKSENKAFEWKILPYHSAKCNKWFNSTLNIFTAVFGTRTGDSHHKVSCMGLTPSWYFNSFYNPGWIGHTRER